MIVITSIVVTPPPVPDPTVDGPIRPVGLQILLTGTDGSTWDLSNGPVRLQPGVSGLGPGDVEHQWATAPRVPGGSRRGYTVPVRSMVLPVFFHAGFDLSFRNLDAMLWQALTPDGDCTLTVVTPDAEVRTLTLAFVGDGDEELDRDPLVMGHAAYPLSFEVGDPYWTGTSVTRVFEDVPEPPPFFVPPGGPGVFNLASDRLTDTATAQNDGDVPAWPVYAVTGPVAGFSVGVGDSTLDYGAVPAGTTVWIDTHPLEQTVGYSRGDNNETAWQGLTRRRFAPIPPGAEVPIVVTLTGAGAGATVAVELTPQYRRPW